MAARCSGVTGVVCTASWPCSSSIDRFIVSATLKTFCTLASSQPRRCATRKAVIAVWIEWVTPYCVCDVAVLAQHLEDGQVGVALDQRLHRAGHVVQRLAEAFLRAGLQRLADAVHALAPQLGQLLRRRLLDVVLGRTQLGHVHQRAAREQRFHLVEGVHHLAARE